MTRVKNDFYVISIKKKKEKEKEEKTVLRHTKIPKATKQIKNKKINPQKTFPE